MSLPLWWPQPGVELTKHYKQSTSTAHRTHLGTFLSFLCFTSLPLTFILSNALAFFKSTCTRSISHPRSSKIISPLLPPWLNNISLTTITFFTSQWPDISEAFPSIPGFNPPPLAPLLSKLYMPFWYHVTNSLTHPYSEPFSYHPFMPFSACPM